MLTFILRRLLIGTVLLFAISLVSFFMITMAPGSPYPWGELNPKVSPQLKEQFRAKFHLDKPIHQQYWFNMRDLFTGRLKSIKDERPVIERIGERLPATLMLNVYALSLSLIFGLLWGVWAARRAGGIGDTLSSVGAFALISLPGFWIAYLTIIVLVKCVGIPVLGTQTYGVEFSSGASMVLDRIWHIVLPGTILALGGIAVQSRYIRATVLEVMREDYIRTARAKGLNEDAVFYKHALRNAVRPLITGIGGLLPALVGGALIIETIFSYPGMGRLGYEAVLERDYPTLVALNFIVASLILLGNLLADVLYAVVDPRVRLE